MKWTREGIWEKDREGDTDGEGREEQAKGEATGFAQINDSPPQDRVDAAPPTTSSLTSCANMHVPIRVIEELTSALE